MRCKQSELQRPVRGPGRAARGSAGASGPGVASAVKGDTNVTSQHHASFMGDTLWMTGSNRRSTTGMAGASAEGRRGVFRPDGLPRAGLKPELVTLMQQHVIQGVQAQWTFIKGTKFLLKLVNQVGARVSPCC